MSELRTMIRILEDQSEEELKNLVEIDPKTYLEENDIAVLQIFKTHKEHDFFYKELRKLNVAKSEILDLAKASQRYTIFFTF